jgi:hypothetical protein
MLPKHVPGTTNTDRQDNVGKLTAHTVLLRNGLQYYKQNLARKSPLQLLNSHQSPKQNYHHNNYHNFMTNHKAYQQ